MLDQLTSKERVGMACEHIECEYAWPDPAWMDVSQIRLEALRYGGQYAILGGEWFPFQ